MGMKKKMTMAGGGMMKKKGMAGGGMMKKKGYAGGGMMKKGYKAGGKMPMVEDPKTGKMIPEFAADGIGKMKGGGRTFKSYQGKSNLVKNRSAKGKRIEEAKRRKEKKLREQGKSSFRGSAGGLKPTTTLEGRLPGRRSMKDGGMTKKGYQAGGVTGGAVGGAAGAAGAGMGRNLSPSQVQMLMDLMEQLPRGRAKMGGVKQARPMPMPRLKSKKPAAPTQARPMKKGGMAKKKGMKAGGVVSKGRAAGGKRGDGIAMKGKTKGRIV